jgi:pilus assembly protein TadC
VDSIILILLIYYLVDILQYVRNKKDNNEIKLDLPKMYDLLSIQDAAGINIGMALTDLFDVVKNKRLKFRLIELSANIIITKNLETSLDSFMGNFNLPELESFVIGIKQSQKTGASKELIENQGEILKEVAVDDKTVEIKNVSIKISIALIFMFLGISLLIIFSFSKLLGSSLKFLFQ